MTLGSGIDGEEVVCWTIQKNYTNTNLSWLDFLSLE